jgi:hypothetical protein
LRRKFIYTICSWVRISAAGKEAATAGGISPGPVRGRPIEAAYKSPKAIPRVMMNPMIIAIKVLVVDPIGLTSVVLVYERRMMI